VLDIHAGLVDQLARQSEVAARFLGEYPGVPVVTIEAQPADVHDLDGLRRVGAGLAGLDAG
jgi:hypothetical protein